MRHESGFFGLFHQRVTPAQLVAATGVLGSFVGVLWGSLDTFMKSACHPWAPCAGCHGHQQTKFVLSFWPDGFLCFLCFQKEPRSRHICIYIHLHTLHICIYMNIHIYICGLYGCGYGGFESGPALLWGFSWRLAAMVGLQTYLYICMYIYACMEDPPVGYVVHDATCPSTIQPSCVWPIDMPSAVERPVPGRCHGLSGH